MVDCLIPCLIAGSELVFQCQPDPGLNLWQPTSGIPRQFWVNFWLKNRSVCFRHKEHHRKSTNQRQAAANQAIFIYFQDII